MEETEWETIEDLNKPEWSRIHPTMTFIVERSRISLLLTKDGYKNEN